MHSSAQDQIWQGYINITVSEEANDNYEYNFIDIKTKQNYLLKFNEKASLKPIRDLVEIKGSLRTKTILVKEYKILNSSQKTRLNYATQSEAQGLQKVNSFIINDPNFPRPLDPEMNTESITASVYNSETSLKNLLEEYSRGKLSITGSTYFLNLPGACSDGVSFSNRAQMVLDYLYHNLPQALDMERMIFFSHQECSGNAVAGLGSLGKYHMILPDDSVQMLSISLNLYNSSGLILHEFGHNLGLHHDNYNLCGEEIFSNDCKSLEYGGVFNTMGAGNFLSFNSINKYDLGWLNSTEIIELDSNQNINQEYSINSLNDDNLAPKTLRIKRKKGDYLYVEYREPKRLELGATTFKNHPGSILYLNNDSYARSSLLLDPYMVDHRNTEIISS